MANINLRRLQRRRVMPNAPGLVPVGSSSNDYLTAEQTQRLFRQVGRAGNDLFNVLAENKHSFEQAENGHVNTTIAMIRGEIKDKIDSGQLMPAGGPTKQWVSQTLAPYYHGKSDYFKKDLVEKMAPLMGGMYHQAAQKAQKIGRQQSYNAWAAARSTPGTLQQAKANDSQLVAKNPWVNPLVIGNMHVDAMQTLVSQMKTADTPETREQIVQAFDINKQIANAHNMPQVAELNDQFQDAIKDQQSQETKDNVDLIRTQIDGAFSQLKDAIENDSTLPVFDLDNARKTVKALKTSPSQKERLLNGIDRYKAAFANSRLNRTDNTVNQMLTAGAGLTDAFAFIDDKEALSDDQKTALKKKYGHQQLILDAANGDVDAFTADEKAVPDDFASQAQKQKLQKEAVDNYRQEKVQNVLSMLQAGEMSPQDAHQLAKVNAGIYSDDPNSKLGWTPSQVARVQNIAQQKDQSNQSMAHVIHQLNTGKGTPTHDQDNSFDTILTAPQGKGQPPLIQKNGTITNPIKLADIVARRGISTNDLNNRLVANLTRGSVEQAAQAAVVLGMLANSSPGLFAQITHDAGDAAATLELAKEAWTQHGSVEDAVKSMEPLIDQVRRRGTLSEKRPSDGEIVADMKDKGLTPSAQVDTLISDWTDAIPHATRGGIFWSPDIDINSQVMRDKVQENYTKRYWLLSQVLPQAKAIEGAKEYASTMLGNHYMMVRWDNTVKAVPTTLPNQQGMIPLAYRWGNGFEKESKEAFTKAGGDASDVIMLRPFKGQPTKDNPSGWFYVYLDANGNPIHNKDGNIYKWYPDTQLSTANNAYQKELEAQAKKKQQPQPPVRMGTLLVPSL